MPSSTALKSTRSRSPSSAPPVIGLIGSNATTAIRSPLRTASLAMAATSVDLPAPGEPVMPTTCAGRRRGASTFMPACASEMLRASSAEGCVVIPGPSGAYCFTLSRTLPTISVMPVPVW